MVIKADPAAFRRAVYAHYRLRGRHELPWRQPEPDGTFDPYKILVSEIMLQQTQVSRVIPKFKDFVERYPDIGSLSNAELGDVLRAWSGLGYNRRAKYLWQSAGIITKNHRGTIPHTVSELSALPGIGSNTAGAVIAYAFNEPVIFIETNIRTVYLHHFFTGQTSVSDKQIIEIITNTLPRTNSRRWYWALMDYGAHLKQSVGNPNRLSSSYSKQSAFAGSVRQLRGQVIRGLSKQAQSVSELAELLPDSRLQKVLDDLVAEELISQTGRKYHL